MIFLSANNKNNHNKKSQLPLTQSELPLKKKERKKKEGGNGVNNES